jgi:hypothetical protein
MSNIEQLLSDNMHLIRPRECVHDALYLVGELPPNYPVPAVLPDYPYDVEWYLEVTAWTNEELDAYLRYAEMCR